jgi:hypothetical protein
MSLQDSIIERHEGSYMITLEGKLDTNTYLDFEEAMRPVLSSSPRLLIFDMVQKQEIEKLKS